MQSSRSLPALEEQEEESRRGAIFSAAISFLFGACCANDYCVNFCRLKR